MSECPETGADTCHLGLPIEDCEMVRNRVVWLVWVRWIVVITVLITVGVGAVLFPTMARWPWLAACGFATAALNAFWHRWIIHGRRTLCAGLLPLFSYQIIGDYLLLAAAMHLTGGVSGPMSPLFVLHGVFSAAILPRWHTAAILATAAALVAGSLLMQHGLGWLPEFLLDDPSLVPTWLSRVIRAGFIMLATVGAGAITLDLAAQIRTRNRLALDLAREVDERNTMLELVDEQRLKLLSVASHDLRSPLAAIETRIDLFLSGYLGQVNDAQREQFGRMKTRLAALRDFINDLLDLAALDAATPQMRPPIAVDLVRQIRSTIGDMSPIAEKEGSTITAFLPEQPVTVIAGPTRLGRVWTNLLSNAIKYGGGGPLTVTVDVDSRPGQVAVSVSDRGMGISAEDQASLFTEYYRTPSAREAGIPGSGLGLSICKRIVESFGGAMEVESTLGRGSTFTVRLPVAEAPAPPPGQEATLLDP